jgi:hypothetical protein
VLLAAAFVQLRIAWAARNAASALHRKVFGRLIYWRVMLVGTLLAYAAALVLGPQRGAPHAFVTLVAVCHTVSLAILSADPQRFGRVATWTRSRTLRRIASAVYLVAAGIAAAEAVLQGIALVQPRSWSNSAGPSLASVLPVPAGRLAPGAPAAAAPQARVAVVGDEAARSLAEAMPPPSTGKLDARSFWRHDADLQDYSAELLDEALGWRPHLLVVCIAVGSDLCVERSCDGGWFDWRSLCLMQWMVGDRRANDPPAVASSPVDSPERYLDCCARRLAICRTPPDDAVRHRWARVRRQLDAIAERCRDADVPLALVVLPGEFQVSQTLCETARRRLGCRPQDIDLEVPQRRLAALAAERRLALVDLLPTLRGAEQPIFARYQQHLSEHGASLAASALSTWLDSRIPSTPAAIDQVTKAR